MREYVKQGVKQKYVKWEFFNIKSGKKVFEIDNKNDLIN